MGGEGMMYDDGWVGRRREGGKASLILQKKEGTGEGEEDSTKKDLTKRNARISPKNIFCSSFKVHFLIRL